MNNQSTIVCVWDTADKTNEDNDYTVCSVWQTFDGYARLIMCYRDKVEFPGLITLFKNVDDVHRPACHFIEDKASGTQLGQLMGNRSYPVELMSPLKDKRALADTFQLFLSNKTFTFNRGALTHEMVNELASYPRGRHDDVPISLFHFLNLFNTNPNLYTLTRKKNGNALASINKAMYGYKVPTPFTFTNTNFIT